MRFLSTVEDPMGELFADPEFVDAYMNAVAADYESRVEEVEFAEREFAFEQAEFTVEQAEDDLSALDWPIPPHVGVEDVVRWTRLAAARRDQWFHNAMTAAAANPENWTDVDDSLAVLVGARGMSVTQARAHCRDLAVAAAVLDIAARTHMSDHQVHSYAHRAQVLQERCPQLWAAYLVGDVAEQNAAKAATIVETLPADPGAWAAFDDLIVEPATRLTPGKFAQRARKIRERVHPESISERHVRAAKDRGVWMTPELDGVGTLFARLTVVDAQIIDEYLDREARALAAHPDETRTLAQLRADVFADILRDPSKYPFHQMENGAVETPDTAGDNDDAGATDADAAPDPAADNSAEPEDPASTHESLPRPKGVTPVVRVTIPALTLLGLSDEPASLDGYGPIDIETAKRLAGAAKSWIRVLTHPITGTVLDVDRKTYRVPAALRRWLDTQYTTCIAPGCNRPAHRSDMDHRKRWSDGGKTSSENLCPLCERHHSIKDETLWQLIRDANSGDLNWLSPTGHLTPVDPPLRVRPIDPTLLITIIDPAESDGGVKSADAAAPAASNAKYEDPPPY